MQEYLSKNYFLNNLWILNFLLIFSFRTNSFAWWFDKKFFSITRRSFYKSKVKFITCQNYLQWVFISIIIITFHSEVKQQIVNMWIHKITFKTRVPYHIFYRIQNGYFKNVFVYSFTKITHNYQYLGKDDQNHGIPIVHFFLHPTTDVSEVKNRFKLFNI